MVVVPMLSKPTRSPQNILVRNARNNLKLEFILVLLKAYRLRNCQKLRYSCANKKHVQVVDSA